MNGLFHFFMNYLIVEQVWGGAMKYVGYIFIFSTFIDLDHLPYILRTRMDILKKGFGSASRSRFHELYGLTLFSIGVVVASSMASEELLKIISLCFILHLASDFIIGRSKPFYPYSRKEVFLGLCPDKYRVSVEIVITLILGGLMWASIVN
ncbi:MAG TPA: hypothetical protein VJG90_07890 [Candidatus Nanoarchaeia archaeon]|nr:hypothetical protein [Candidatus Nanoarchaeia archaeon]